jgi:hypothetical protein
LARASAIKFLVFANLNPNLEEIIHNVAKTFMKLLQSKNLYICNFIRVHQWSRYVLQPIFFWWKSLVLLLISDLTNELHLHQF